MDGRTQQAVKEVVGSAVKREVDAAIEKHAHSLSPETRRQEERKQMQVSHTRTRTHTHTHTHARTLSYSNVIACFYSSAPLCFPPVLFIRSSFPAGESEQADSGAAV